MDNAIAHSSTYPAFDELTEFVFMDKKNPSGVPAPYVEIIEQPAPDSHTFRYGSEIKGDSLGAVLGVHSKPEAKTYPTIKIIKYQGPFEVTITCVTKDGPPHRPHPNKLLGKEHCDKNGVYKQIMSEPDMTHSFRKLSIKRVRIKDKKESLEAREETKVDPYETGFNDSENIDLKALRLCFQVSILGPDGCFSVPLRPVVSDTIYDRKSMKLNIVRLSRFSAPASGGTEVIMFCDPVDINETEVWFYEKQGTAIVWESQATFYPTDVHKRVAITFKTPRYTGGNKRHAFTVYVELRHRTTKKRSEPRKFKYIPLEREMFFTQDNESYQQPSTFSEPIRSPISTIPPAPVVSLSSYQYSPVSALGTSPTLPSHSSVVSPVTPIPQPSTSSKYCKIENETKISFPAECSFTSSHFPSASLPVLATSLGAYSQAPVTPQTATQRLAVTPECSTFFDNYRSPDLTSMPVPAECSSTSSHFPSASLPVLAASPGIYSQASVTPKTATEPLAITPQYSTSFDNYRSPDLTSMPVPAESLFNTPDFISDLGEILDYLGETLDSTVKDNLDEFF